MTTVIIVLIVGYLLTKVVRTTKAQQRIETQTVVSTAAEPQNWGPYAMPAFLRKEGAEASRVRRDLSEFRQDLDADAGDWIERQIRRQIAGQDPA
jgi:hypothetical protein